MLLNQLLFVLLEVLAIVFKIRFSVAPVIRLRSSQTLGSVSFVIGLTTDWSSRLGLGRLHYSSESGSDFISPDQTRMALTQMNPRRYNQERHEYGTKKETELQALLEAFTGEPMTKTRHLYDIIDFESASFCVELKSRKEHYHPSSFRTWLLPACKADLARRTAKTSLFFYWWDSTKELYVIEYDPALFATYERGIPEWHAERQEHLWIPASDFSLVQFVYE